MKNELFLKTGLKASLLTLSIFVSTSVLAGDTLRLDAAAAGEVDPAIASDFADSINIHNIYDTLVATGPGEGRDLIPSLAKEWIIEGNIYTFYLRDDVKFSSGNPLAAGDVVYSVKRMLKMGRGFSYLLKGKIKSVALVNNKTVRFELNQPYAPFLFALKKVGIVDSKVVKAKGEKWLSKNSAGSGPYIIQSHNPQNLTVLVKNNNYWGYMDNKAPDTVRFLYGLETSTVRAAMMKGKHDLGNQWMPPEVLRALDRNKKIKIVSSRAGGMFYVKMNTRKVPFDDLACRKAFAHAFNYKAVIDIIRVNKDKSSGSPANGPIPAGMIGNVKDAPPFKQNITKAKEYLAQCKYKPKDMNIELAWMAEVPIEERFALLMQSDLKKIGIKSTVKKIPWVLFQDLASKKETTPDVTQIFVTSTSGDPDSLIYQQYHSSTAGTWSATEWLHSKKLDALLDKARGEIDVYKRTAIYEKISKMVVDLQPAVFGYEMIQLMPMNKRIKWPPLEDPKHSYPMSAYDVRFSESAVGR